MRLVLWNRLNRRVRRSMLVSASVIALSIGSAGLGMSDKAAAETLRDAMASAYKYNPRIDAERARLRATDETVPQAKSGYRPTVVGSADAGYQRTNTEPRSPGDGEAHPHGYQLTMTQPIFNGFRTLNAVRSAEANVRAGREILRQIEQTVLLEAVTAFMDVVRDQAIARLRENNVNVLSRELRAVEDRFAVGEVTRTDVAQARARRAGAVSALDLARANLRASRAAYERTVGRPPSNLTEPPLTANFIPKSLPEARAIAAKEHPSIVQSLYREQAARHTVDQIWGELLPSVTVDATYQHRYDTSRLVDESEATTVTGRVNVPLYEAGEVRARVRGAKHVHVSRLQEIEQFRAEVLAAVIAAWAQYEASRAQLVSDQQQVESNRIALAGVREEERVGQRTLLDVLNAEQELLNSEVQIVSTRRNIVVNSYALLSAVGRLNVQDLSLTATAYDPEAHYLAVRRAWFTISITHPDGRREHLNAAPEGGPPPRSGWHTTVK